MNEEAVELGKKQLQEGLTYEQVVAFFITQTLRVVEDTMQTFKDEDAFGLVEQAKLPRMKEELRYFFLFALDYWWQKNPFYTQEQKRILEKVLFYRLDSLFGDDEEGRATWNALQERFITYGQVATELEQKDESLMVSDFAMKLSECCGMKYLPFAILVPTLFATAMKTVFVLKGDKRRSKRR